MNFRKKNIHSVFQAALAMPTAIIGLGFIPAALAQDNGGKPAAKTTAEIEEIRVTARRMEENIQDVPISISVFNQDQLDQKNIVTGADLVNYTPSLSVNNRFGSDQASFAIRGFTQELRTAASVAVYFADVVAPRGGGSITSGDGAGPGAFFDLQNVQVLKGPQGTLFGRNTTGGAILLVPQRPTDKLEGYVEQSLGNYNMRRSQGVINVPLSDSVRTRFGIDTQKRDGYIRNVSGVGPDRFSDVDYLSGRASLIADITDSLENYTIFSYTNSENNGTLQGMFACNEGVGLADLCSQTLAHQGSGFYTVENDMPDPVSKLRQRQIINTTTWDVTDDFTIKNILSYADLEQNMRSTVFGTNYTVPASAGPAAGSHIFYFPSGQWPGIATNNQTTVVEELRFQGVALDKKLTWQGGLYYENSKPDGTSGSLSPILIGCTAAPGGDPSSWNCSDILGGLAGPSSGFSGAVQSNLGKIEYLNTAIYSQATYEFSDEFKLTAGLRYTVDKTDGEAKQVLYHFTPYTLADLLAGNPVPYGAPTEVKCAVTTATLPNCVNKLHQKSEAPTWVIDVDYLPTPDMMLYAKYSRGYRQGSVNIFGVETLQTFDPEKVDAYEIGAKTTFYGPIPGTFNIAAFYNDLKDQQIQVGYQSTTGYAPTTAIVNAGASTIKGVEVDTALHLLDDLMFNLSYTYLATELKEMNAPALRADVLANYPISIPAAVAGGPLAQSPRHTITASLNYRLPLPVDIGDVSFGTSYTFVSEQLTADAEPYGTLPSYHTVGLNAYWKNIMSSAFDASLFMTNATNEKITTYVPGLYASSGAEYRVVGEPRMWGARVKYNFGR